MVRFCDLSHEQGQSKENPLAIFTEFSSAEFTRANSRAILDGRSIFGRPEKDETGTNRIRIVLNLPASEKLMPDSRPAIARLFAIAILFSSFVPATQSIAQESSNRQTAKQSQADAKKQTAKKAKIQPALAQSIADQTTWRSVGPANMGGRITAITVYEKDPSIWWAATASGGLLKTTNNGRTLEHQFDDQNTVSIGDVQVSQSNPDIVWVGTGESNPRNSVSWGDGVYKSTDGGKTWKNMGLKKSFQTGALAIHPENPDVVWAGALGRLWGPNEERGLFKTTNGGTTWNKVLYVDDKTGVIDVQIDPKNPDNLLVATYERKRDGFDGNDPVQRFGDGSGIYKSTDGGESFERITEGLPNCKMGRIGLDYFEADPNVVVAIVESEKIAKRPESSPYLGIRGENADVGARMTNVTKDGPADKAGMKDGDIVVSVDENIVMSYEDFLGEVRKHQAGETIAVVVSRDRKEVEVEVKLGKRPKTRRASSRNEFTGTLGGQAANLQGQQGPNENDYGGVYLSEDGGSSWKRINTLNPRPMYYSNIQIDPVDRNNIYVCGTSLYRSKDGGETFTGDGGSDGIHVDHHALWIDKRDPRHMILGNDGGVHVTYDRMEHWDHLNHVAIGQFYHAGIDATMDYKVYGGLQDNGSWGGPSRGKARSGPVNSDWYRVGSGDGFVTLVDPKDPNQIYFESQNGGMGRIHLETGERGFIRPRPPRGVRYRFNWKTPFLLSPHNSKVHYSAGNYVFRSFDRGNRTQAISPDITNTTRGAGSAISESAVQPGLIYVGTTDGAVWKTADGGNTWSPLAYQPAKAKPSDKKKDEKSTDKKTDDQKKDVAKKAKAEAADENSDEAKSDDKKSDDAKPVDSVSGNWTANMISDRLPAGRGEFKIQLKLDGKKVSGFVESRRGKQEIEDGDYDASTGKISFTIEGQGRRGQAKYSGIIEGKEMNGELSFAQGRGSIDFSAIKDDGKATKKDSATQTSDLSRFSAVSIRQAMIGMLQFDDPISGQWAGVIENENLPGGRIEFTIEFKMDEKNELSGTIVSQQGDSEIVSGTYNAETNRIIFEAENDDFIVDIEADVSGKTMSGTMTLNAGELETDFEATKKDSAPKTEDSKLSTKDLSKNEKKVDPKDVPMKKPADKAPANKAKVADDAEPQDQGKPKLEKPKSEKAKSAKQKSKQAEAKQTKPKKAKSDIENTGAQKPVADEKTKNDDPVTGQWEGNMISPRGEREMKMTLNLNSKDEITGTFESTQGEREISSGKFDPATNALNLVSDTEQFTLTFDGKIEGEQYNGEIDVNEGSFTMEFELTRKAKNVAKPKAVTKKAAAPAKPEYKQPTGEKSLSKLLPGPRWVSSIEASKFKRERCYMTFDGHRSNDDGVYLFVTNDGGKTWESLKNNIPDSAGSARVLREDTRNENLLFLGCEFSSWYSIDAGKTWTRIKGGLPTVAVHEFAIHDKRAEVVAATHGRSLWIADISILRQLSSAKLAEDMHLYQPADSIAWSRRPVRGNSGTRRFVGTNPARGTNIAYSLGKNARRVRLTLHDLKGDVIKTFDTSTRKGFHQIRWDLSRDSTGGRGRFTPSVGTGKYLLTLNVDGEKKQRVVNVIADPERPPQSPSVELEETLFGN